MYSQEREVRRAVVSGGCGFIGSRLANALIGAGVEVTVFDIAPPPTDLEPQCRVEERDIRISASLRGAVETADVVYALAARLAKTCDEDPQNGWSTNVQGTANLLHEVLESGRKPRVVFTSSGSVYDAFNRTLPIPETYSLRPQGVYAASKLAGEGMLAAAAAVAGFSGVIFRPFTVFGRGPASGQRGHFIASWVERAAAGLPLTLYGDGTNTVDLAGIDDVVRALFVAASVSIPDGQCRTYNLGGGRETSVNEVARWMREANSSIRVKHVPAPRFSPTRQFADLSRVRDELGYQPQADLAGEIKALIRFSLAGGR